MTRIVEMSREELESRQKAILDKLGMTYEELAAKAKAHSLVADEWAAWEELREIDFLLKDD